MRPGWIYFWFFAWLASPAMFYSLFLAERGLKSTEISLIASVSSFFTIFSSTFITSYADVLANTGYVHSKEMWMAFCLTMSTFAFLTNSLAELGILTLTPASSFYFYMAIKIVEAMFQTTIHHLAKAITMEFLNLDNNTNGYGKERLYASVAWGSFSCFVGLGIDYFGTTQVLYFAKLGTTLCFLVVLYRYTTFKRELTPVPKYNMEEKNSEKKIDGWGFLGILFSTSVSAVFVTLYAVVNSGRAIVSNQAFPFFRKIFGATNLTCGLSVTVSVIFEIPIMWNSGMLLEKIGPHGLLMCGSICFCIRVLGYTLISEGGFVLLLLETLHGVTFGFSDTASTAFINTIAASDSNIGAQVIFHTLVKIVTIIVSTIGGAVEDMYGGIVLFRGSALIMSAFLMLFIGVTFLQKQSLKTKIE